MNREQEHNTLKEELISTTPELGDIFLNAQTRMRKRNVRNHVLTPLATCMAVFVIFVGLVNFSPTVAMAMERIPALQRLAEAVSFSPSLTEAVENEFVQVMELEQLVGDDVIMRVEYVVVGGDQLHVFYTLDSLTYPYLEISVGARGAITAEFSDCCVATPDICCYRFITATMLLHMNPGPEIECNELRHFVAGFEESVPPVVIFEGEVFEQGVENYFGGRLIGNYAFVIVIDEVFTAKEIYEVNKEFDIDGQGFEVTTVEINPAHTRVNIETDWRSNTKELAELIIYMENEDGERFNPPAPGCFTLRNLPAGATGYDEDGPWRIEDHFIDSAFFAESESLVIVILGAVWMNSETTMLEEPIEIQVK